MKLSILQENLSHGLALVSRSVASRATLPILSNLLLAIDKGRLKLSGTNLETGINLWLGAKIEQEGAMTIPARVFSEFVTSLPPGKIDLESQETTLLVSSLAFKASFVGTAATEFPKIPSFTEKPILIFEKEKMTEAFNQVAFAAAQDEGRPVLTGVLIRNTEKEETVLVATDGFRLSLKKILAKKRDLQGDLLIPAKTLLEVSRLAQENGEENQEIKATLTEEKSQIIFSFSEIEFSSRLLEGEFPDFAKIVPTSFQTKAEFDKEEFLRAVKVASIFAREQANIIKLRIEEGKMKILAETPQVGTNENEIMAKTEGEKVEIAFNCRFILDFLNSTKGTEVSLEANGPLAPGVFKIKEDASFLHLVMPVRIQS